MSASSRSIALDGPRLLGRFVVTHRLRADPFAPSFRALDLRHDRWRRLQLAPAPARVVRDLHAFRRLADIDQPHLLQLVDIPDDAVPLIVYEWHDGRSLADRLAGGLGLAGPETVHIVNQWLSGLKAFHDHAGPHGALRPDTARIDTAERGRIVPASPFAESLPEEASAYVAPECRDDPTKLGLASDIFSMGALLYALGAGSHPPADLERWFGRGGSIEGIPGALRPVVERLCAPDPFDRPHNLEAVSSLLYRSLSRLAARSIYRGWAKQVGDESIDAPPFPELEALVGDASTPEPQPAREVPLLPEATPTLAPMPLDVPPVEPRPPSRASEPRPRDEAPVGAGTPLSVIVLGAALGSLLAFIVVAIVAVASSSGVASP